MALCEHSTVVVGRKGAYRGIHYSAGPSYIIDTAFYLEPRIEFDMRWAYYELLTHDINALDTGSAIPSTTRDTFYSLSVRVPPIGEQRRISSILGSLDDKIEINRRMNQTLEEICRALFKFWFSDFGPVRAKKEGRWKKGESLPGMPADTWDLWPRAFEESEIGDIPKGWSAQALGPWLDVIETGSRPSGGVSDFTEGVPSVGAESIIGIGKYDFGKTKFVPSEFHARMPRGKVVSRDVLLYKDGGRPGEYEPHVSLLGDGFPFDEFCINEHVYRLRVKPPLGQSYLFFWLSSGAAMEEMRQRGTGVAIPGINSTAVRSISLLVPSGELCLAFERVVEPLVARILLNSCESTQLSDIRDALLPKLLSGEIRLR